MQAETLWTRDFTLITVATTIGAAGGIAAGFAANRLGYLGGETDQRISKLLLNITMPAMIVAAVVTGEELPEIGTILSILEVSVVFYLLAFAFVLLVPRFLPGTPGQKGVWRYALAFPNVGFIGYPVAVALFGDGALFYAAVLALPFNLLSFSLGPLLLAGAARFRWKQLFAPCIVASVLGLVLAYFVIRSGSLWTAAPVLTVISASVSATFQLP